MTITAIVPARRPLSLRIKPPLGTPLNTASPLTSGLVGAWLFNENGGASCRNLVDGNASTITSPAYRVGPFSGQALNCNGSATVALPNLGVSGNQARSIVVWIYPTSSNTLYAIVSWGGGGNDQLCSVYFNSSLRDISLSFASDTWGTADNIVTLNTWNQVVCTFAGGTTSTTTVKIYINGISKTITGGGTVSSPNTTDANYGIGYDAPFNLRKFVGAVDHALIYNRALSAAEVSQLYVDPFAFARRAPKAVILTSTTAVTGVGTASATSTASGVGVTAILSTATGTATSTASGVGASLDLGIGTASATSTASGVGASLDLGIGTASGDSTATAVGASVDQGTGTASATSTASAVGASLDQAIGSASGDSSASGVGASLDTATGTATGTSTATAVGASLDQSTGTASGDSSASGVGASLDLATGTASATSTASGVGASLDQATGIAGGNSTASGVGASINLSTGIANGDSTASGMKGIPGALPGPVWVVRGVRLVYVVEGSRLIWLVPRDKSTWPVPASSLSWSVVGQRLVWSAD